jgi:hypothetical protein
MELNVVDEGRRHSPSLLACGEWQLIIETLRLHSLTGGKRNQSWIEYLGVPQAAGVNSMNQRVFLRIVEITRPVRLLYIGNSVARCTGSTRTAPCFGRSGASTISRRIAAEVSIPELKNK